MRYPPTDRRPVLTRAEAKDVYNGFARTGHKTAGRDAAGGYGGPAVQALLAMAALGDARTVLDYGCGQAKLAELALETHSQLTWYGADMSDEMVELAKKRMERFGPRFQIEHIPSGEPSELAGSWSCADRFISTYCLDLLSEDDMDDVLDLARRSLHPTGLLLLSGITWGYRDSMRTCFMTGIWELLYMFRRRVVGGCRPQALEPYLQARGWAVVERARTLPQGFPWMVSEVIAARPPPPKSAA